MFCLITVRSMRIFRPYEQNVLSVATPRTAARLRVLSTVSDESRMQRNARLDEPPQKQVLHYANGKTYKGEVVDGKKHGSGVLTFPDGQAFSGVFHFDRLVSGSGSYKWANNTVCTGVWEKGKLQGLGKTVDASGNIVEGEFRDGKMYVGKLFTLTKEGHVQTGSWVDGKFTKLKVDIPFENLTLDEAKKVRVINTRVGHGTYTGETLFGKRHGMGKFVCTQYSYSGHWVHNQRSGEGKIYYADKSWYQGEWRADTYNGRGTLHNADGTVLTGEFRNGRIHNGTGKLVIQSSQETQWRYSFEGTWVEGKLQGQGTKTLDNYYTYVGTFKDGQLHGQGFLREITGEEWRGEFRHNEVYRGEGSLVLPDGTVLHGRWEDGKHVEASEE